MLGVIDKAMELKWVALELVEKGYRPFVRAEGRDVVVGDDGQVAIIHIANDGGEAAMLAALLNDELQEYIWD